MLNKHLNDNVCLRLGMECLKMVVEYRVWLKERENLKSRMQFVKTVFDVQDLIESAHDLLIEESDDEWECYKIDLVDIISFT